MIKLDHVNKTFGNNVVLKDISLSISKGEIFGLIGKNGAGNQSNRKEEKVFGRCLWISSINREKSRKINEFMLAMANKML